MRCPVCRADDNRTAQCRRCKADLNLLVCLERERTARLQVAERHAGCGEAEACIAHAQRANALHMGKESLRLLALGSLLRKDFAAAWSAYQRWAQLL